MSYLLIALPYLLQLLCIIHVVRTGRNTSWIWLIIFVPYVGGVAYLLVEVLPTLGRGGRRTLVSTRDIVERTFNPTARLKALERTAAFSQTHENERALADEYAACGDHAKALVLYEKLASGMHARDADLVLARARCFYGLGRHQVGTRLLDELEAAGHDFRTIPEALVRLKLMEGAGSDGVAVIDRAEEAKRQLDAMGQPFDRAWMRRVLRLRATIRE